ncbi:unnamed protein product [Phyllotreta striolata]|uniref:Odorant receptor n=1 Tax=Phyllotreta striolata TaxID=444603 RepID=A0A9N9TPN2_PHYSR|nr:unnamed protein product [Phyllotreta striolata]
MYYPITKNEPYHSTLLSLSLLGLYPRSSSAADLNVSLAATVGTIVFGLMVCNIGGIGHLIVSFKGNKGAEMTEDLAVAVGGLGFLLCATFFKIKWRKWAEFCQSITDFENYGRPGDFNKVKDRCNLLSLMYSFYISGGMCVYAVISIFETKCDQDEQNNFCGTLTQIRLPIEGEISPVTIKVIFAFQLLVCIWACVAAGNLFFLSYESSEFLICHINWLKRNIIGIFDDDDELSRKGQLRFCIEYHNQILDWGDDLNQLTKSTLGHMSLIAAIVMGMIGNQITQKYKMFGAAIYLGGYIMSIFLLSHAGQRLCDESLSISEAVFDSKWNEASNEMRKDLAFMIARSHEPLTISSLPLGTFNYDLFVTMLKASYSYLTLLQQSTSNDEEQP